MFKALAYCNQRYISSLKLVRELIDASDEVIIKNANTVTDSDISKQPPNEPPENTDFDKGDDAL